MPCNYSFFSKAFNRTSIATALLIYSYKFEGGEEKELGTKQDAAVMFVCMRQGRGLKMLLFKYYSSSKFYVSTNRNVSMYFLHCPHEKKSKTLTTSLFLGKETPFVAIIYLCYRYLPCFETLLITVLL